MERILRKGAENRGWCGDETASGDFQKINYKSAKTTPLHRHKSRSWLSSKVLKMGIFSTVRGRW